MIKEIFYEVINEARFGKVVINNDEWEISFNTLIDGKRIDGREDNILLEIKNSNEFFNLLEEYVELELNKNRKTFSFSSNEKRERIKYIISYLFVNATTQEFANPITLLKRRISFLKDNTFDSLEEELKIDMGNILENTSLAIKKETNSLFMETPYSISLSIKSGNNTFHLPKIYYGIDNDTCYIFGIQSQKQEENNEEAIRFNKKINRLLYRLNDKVEDTEEYNEYKNNQSDYYPEGNISDVTMSFVFALNIFESLLETKNIRNIKAVTYLPLRYKSRDIAAEKSGNDSYRIRNDSIQNNLTNKFIRTFLRLAYHNKNMEITSYPYEYDEFLTIKINDKKDRIDNMLLSSINDTITAEKNVKK